MLPPEILLAIRSFIPVSDLRTHVCFYNASPCIAALYDSEPDPDLLWRRSCWYCGIGCSCEMGRETSSTAFWRTLALGLIQSDGFCSHPLCGEAALEYNRQRMQHALSLISPLSIKWSWTFEDLDHEQVGPAHRVLAHIVYPGDTSILDETYVQSFSSPPRRHAHCEDTIILADHPILWRSFASDVPVYKMLLGIGDGMIHTRVPVSNPCGVTVLDVVSAIHNKLDTPISPDDILDFVKNHRSHFPDVPFSTTSAIFDHMRTLRAIMDVCPINEYKHCWAMALRTGLPYFMVNLK